MKITFFWIGATRVRELARLEDRYLERIGHFLPVEKVVVPEASKRDPRQARAQEKREARWIHKRLTPGSLLVGLDPEGTQLSSLQLAEFVGSHQDRGTPELTFLVGGHLGLPEEIQSKIGYRLSLGILTLTHEMARVVLAEQVYRAMTILKGLPYHR